MQDQASLLEVLTRAQRPHRVVENLLVHRRRRIEVQVKVVSCDTSTGVLLLRAEFVPIVQERQLLLQAVDLMLPRGLFAEVFGLLFQVFAQV